MAGSDGAFNTRECNNQLTVYFGKGKWWAVQKLAMIVVARMP